MDDLKLLIDVDVLPITALVMDMIFNPPFTPLLRTARAHGCQVLNGLSMLLYQGALAFELWTGRPAPIESHAKGHRSCKGRLKGCSDFLHLVSLMGRVLRP